MKLVPIKSGSGTNGSHVPGRVEVHISPDKQQLIGLRTSVVEKRHLSHTIRATGIVQYDETRLFKMTPRFEGFVQKLFANFTGQPVKKGDPLFTIYSPELYATERKYVLAFEQFQKAHSGGSTESKESARSLLESARKRLELWQIDEQEIRRIEESRDAKDQLTFRAPVSGHVLSKTAVEGKSIMAGETLYEIADLSRVWVKTAIYEYDLPRIQLGQKARVILPFVGKKTYESEVTFIYPHLDPQTRRAEIRLELENPERELRPEMWADVEIEIPLGEALTIPDSAVIDTGRRHVAFVERDDGVLEPREVKVGAKTDSHFEIVDGLKEGEKVVTRALFLVDSESQLKAAVAGMGTEGHEH